MLPRGEPLMQNVKSHYVSKHDFTPIQGQSVGNSPWFLSRITSIGCLSVYPIEHPRTCLIRKTCWIPGNSHVLPSPPLYVKHCSFLPFFFLTLFPVLSLGVMQFAQCPSDGTTPEPFSTCRAEQLIVHTGLAYLGWFLGSGICWELGSVVESLPFSRSVNGGPAKLQIGPLSKCKCC